MAEINTSRLRELLTRTVGPAPWYWKTFPKLHAASGQPLSWTHHGEQGMLAYLISLAPEQDPDKPRLALNTYCRPFLMPSKSGWRLVSGRQKYPPHVFRHGTSRSF